MCLVLTCSNVSLLSFIHTEDLIIKGVMYFTFLVKKQKKSKY